MINRKRNHKKVKITLKKRKPLNTIYNCFTLKKNKIGLKIAGPEKYKIRWVRVQKVKIVKTVETENFGRH